MKSKTLKYVSLFLGAVCLSCLVFLSSCEKGDALREENIVLSKEIEATKEWFDVQMEQDEKIKAWDKAYLPDFEWGEAKMLVSEQNDTIIEIPYSAKKKYKFGIGPVGKRGEKLISKYIEPQATRVAISKKSNNFKAQLMQLFSDTLYMGTRKIFYDTEVLKDINFANSFFSSPKYAALIFYEGFDGKFDSYKYYERGKVREQGGVVSNVNNVTGAYQLRSTCEWYTMATYHQACIEVGGFTHCEPYWTYDYVISCSSDPVDSYDSDPYGDQAGGSSGGETNSPDPLEEGVCIFQSDNLDLQVARLSTSYSANLSTVVAYVRADCNLASSGNPARALYIYVNSTSGGSATIQSQSADLNNSFVGRDENRSCVAAHTYHVKVSLQLTPHVLNVNGGYKDVSGGFENIVQPVTRSSSTDLTFKFWGRG